jgi:hypothetical protein
VTAHLPGLEIEIFTVGHRVDGEQISINVRAVFSGDSQPVLRPRKIAPRAIATHWNAFSTMQMLVSLTETSSPAKWSMLRFSF